MQIISGTAKRIILTVPKGLSVRPTSVRARKGLFDSLGLFTNARVVDLFAGSGSLGLEAASRGADAVLFVEKDYRHCQILEENIQKIRKTGVAADMQVFRGDAAGLGFRHKLLQPDVIFADPPYPVSLDLFQELSTDSDFLDWGRDALLVWEIPDEPGAVGTFNACGFAEARVRQFGGTSFLLAIIAN